VIDTKKLQRAIKRLDGTEDRPRARRNARRRVLAALRAVRAQVDREYPALSVAKAPRKKGLKAVESSTAVVKVMRARGWGIVYEAHEDASSYAVHGIRVRKVRDMLFVPAWAKAIGLDKPAELRAALKSVKLRRAAVAAQALAST